MAGANMKALTLLAVLLCLEEAWGIKCHSCSNTGDTCEKETTCLPTATACYSQTTRNKIDNIVQTIKDCATSCKDINPIKSRETLQETSFYCCNTDLCNGAGAQGPGATTVGLMLVASVLTTLLGASV